MQQQSPEEIAAARRIMACQDFIPLPVRFLLFLVIIIVYQFSGGVYMSAVSHMSGAMSWINEDIMMAGYASLVGLTVTFPVLFRVMFRFTARNLLLLSTAVLIVGDWICMVSDFVPLVVFTSFVCGFFKIDDLHVHLLGPDTAQHHAHEGFCCVLSFPFYIYIGMRAAFQYRYRIQHQCFRLAGNAQVHHRRATVAFPHNPFLSAPAFPPRTFHSVQ